MSNIGIGISPDWSYGYYNSETDIATIITSKCFISFNYKKDLFRIFLDNNSIGISIWHYTNNDKEDYTIRKSTYQQAQEEYNQIIKQIIEIETLANRILKCVVDRKLLATGLVSPDILEREFAEKACEIIKKMEKNND